MFRYSKAGVKDIKLFELLFFDFIAWCKTVVNHGTFSTYCDGEPVCFSDGDAMGYREYLKITGK